MYYLQQIVPSWSGCCSCLVLFAFYHVVQALILCIEEQIGPIMWKETKWIYVYWTQSSLTSCTINFPLFRKHSNQMMKVNQRWDPFLTCSNFTFKLRALTRRIIVHHDSTFPRKNYAGAISTIDMSALPLEKEKLEGAIKPINNLDWLKGV